MSRKIRGSCRDISCWLQLITSTNGIARGGLCTALLRLTAVLARALPPWRVYDGGHKFWRHMSGKDVV